MNTAVVTQTLELVGSGAEVAVLINLMVAAGLTSVAIFDLFVVYDAPGRMLRPRHVIRVVIVHEKF